MQKKLPRKPDPRLRPGTNHCLCPTCGQYFTNEKNFDLHRAGNAQDRRCVYPGLVVDKNGNARLRRRADGLWVRPGKHPRETARESLSVRGKSGFARVPDSPCP